MKIELELPITPRLKRAIAIAQKKAKELGHNYIGVEHVSWAIADNRIHEAPDKPQDEIKPHTYESMHKLYQTSLRVQELQ